MSHFVVSVQLIICLYVWNLWANIILDVFSWSSCLNLFMKLNASTSTSTSTLVVLVSACCFTRFFRFLFRVCYACLFLFAHLFTFLFLFLLFLLFLLWSSTALVYDVWLTVLYSFEVGAGLDAFRDAGLKLSVEPKRKRYKVLTVQSKLQIPKDNWQSDANELIEGKDKSQHNNNVRNVLFGNLNTSKLEFLLPILVSILVHKNNNQWRPSITNQEGSEEISIDKESGEESEKYLKGEILDKDFGEEENGRVLKFLF